MSAQASKLLDKVRAVAVALVSGQAGSTSQSLPPPQPSMTKSAKLGVRELLLHWEHSLGGDGLTLFGRLWNILRGNTLSVAGAVFLMGMVLMSVAMAGKLQGSQGLVKSIIDMVYAVSLFGCSAAQMFFRQNRAAARVVLQRLAEVASEMESSDGDKEKEALDQAARSARVWYRGMKVYASLAVVSVTLPHAATLKPVPAVWPAVSGVGEPLLALAFTVVSIQCCIGYSEFLSLQLVASISSTGLYRVLGARYSQAAGQKELLRDAARLHGELNGAVVQLDRLFAPYLPYYLFPPLGGTALATCGVLYGTFSSNFMSLVPQIFIIFMPLCMNGDALRMASGAWLSEDAYDGAWLESCPQDRRVVVMAMVRCTRPQTVSVKAFGRLDREACLSVLKTWFSFLQTLTNLSVTH